MNPIDFNETCSDDIYFDNICFDNNCFDDTYSDDICFDDICFLTKNPNSIDIILSYDSLTIEEKKNIIKDVLEIVGIHNLQNTFLITPETITKLLCQKEETRHFIDLFYMISKYCHLNGLDPFSYDHLYNLILQTWLDIPKIISIEFRKYLISIAFNNCLPSKIIDQIIFDMNIWFANIGKNSDITHMINWICIFDKSGRLNDSKNKYQENMKQSMDNNKLFKKKYNITPGEYKIQQHNAKKNGLCKYIREGEKCNNNINCKFYHGRIEETYGVQFCIHNENCERIAFGECKFVHKPTKNQSAETIKFYSLFDKIGDNFVIESSKTKYIDIQRYSNPFIILKKEKIEQKFVHYSVPKCSCIGKNDFGVEYQCTDKVKFMTKKNGDISNFYCSFEHMNMYEPNCSYVVKQNILDQVFLCRL